MSAPLRLRPVAVSLASPRRRSLRGWRGLLALSLTALCVWSVALAWTPLPTPPFRQDMALRGAYHLHSDASHDSHVSLESYALAAKERGLDFLVLTEHDVQRSASEVLHGVLLIHQSELNFAFGHVVSLGAERALDWAERADPHGLQRIATARGHGIVAHPTSTRRPWRGPMHGLRGLEVQNAAASLEHYVGAWWLHAAPLALAYAVHPSLALAQLYERDTVAHAMWDALPEDVVGLAGIDAHGWLRPQWDLAAWQVVAPTLQRPAHMSVEMTGPIVQAMVTGQTYASAGVWQQPVDLGWELLPGSDSQTNAPTVKACAGVTPHRAMSLVLLHDGAEVASGPLPCLQWPQATAGLWRAEVRASLPRVGRGTYDAVIAISPRMKVHPAS